MLLGLAVQTKGLGSRFASARQRPIAAWKSTRKRSSPSQAALARCREEALDRVQPRARGRGEVEDPARVPLEPRQHLGVFVGGVVVQDGVDQLAGRDCGLDGVEEMDELLVAVPLHAATDHRPVQHVERGEQRGRVVARSRPSLSSPTCGAASLSRSRAHASSTSPLRQRPVRVNEPVPSARGTSRANGSTGSGSRRRSRACAPAASGRRGRAGYLDPVEAAHPAWLGEHAGEGRARPCRRAGAALRTTVGRSGQGEKGCELLRRGLGIVKVAKAARVGVTVVYRAKVEVAASAPA